MSERRSYGRPDYSEPQYSRLFIVCSRELSSDDIYKHFDKFGKIEEVRVVKDRHTGENKGIVYIQFSKTSEAAKALEEMNGKSVGGSSRPIKVLVASSREQGCKRDQNEGEKYIRLFVVVPRNMKEEELETYFKQFGNVQFASIIRDKSSNESKGFAYITFQNFYQAALAFENCDKSYRAVFAEPKPSKKDRGSDRGGNSSWGSNSDPYSTRQESHIDGGCPQLIVTASPTSNQDQLWRLFDLIPGLDYCQPANNRSGSNIYVVVYNNSKAALTARDKLHGFEYPPGYRLIVKLDPDMSHSRSESSSRGQHQLTSMIPQETLNSRPDIAQLAETIAQATSLIQAAGINMNPFAMVPKDNAASQCSVKLPPVQALAPVDSPVAMRCFIVCAPQPPSIHVMRDAFSRFGDLIDVYLLNHKNCGYAKYASVRAAEEAIRVLHGAELCGIRLKVLEAEEPKHSSGTDQRRKRLKRSATPEEDNEVWT